jgi:hypothetical protein
MYGLHRLSLIIMAILLFSGCSYKPGATVCKFQKPSIESGYGSTCMNIQGTVAGDIISGAQVYLFQPSSLNFSVVLTEIRTIPALGWRPVNESGAFEFHCLSAGEYVFVIPTTSYNGWIGFPMPYEFDCENFSVRIVFHGGDYQYAVGAFRVIDSRVGYVEKCTDSSWICRDLMGSLFRECRNNSGLR